MLLIQLNLPPITPPIVPIQVSDSGTGTDTNLVTAQLALTDAGLGTDSYALNLLVSDLGTGSDTSFVSISGFISETAAGFEDAAISVSLSGEDSAVTSDFADVLVDISLADSAVGDDSLTKFQLVELSESATGQDSGYASSVNLDPVNVYSGDSYSITYDDRKQGTKDRAKGGEVISMAAWIQSRDDATATEIVSVEKFDPDLELVAIALAA